MKYIYTLTFLLSTFSIFAQVPTEREATDIYFARNYSQSGQAFEQILKNEPKNGVALLGVSKSLFMKHEEILAKEAFRNKFKDFQFHLDMLKKSYDFSLGAAVAYKTADSDRQKGIRQAFSVTEDHIVQQFPESIMKEAYTIITNAPYRKNLLMLYQSNIYDKYADADTVESLRETLIQQCKQYLVDYPYSPYKPRIEQYKYELLIDYTQIESLRQFGDRTGRVYEKFCDLIIEQYPAEKLAHIVPQYYGAEYGWTEATFSTHQHHRKLKELASANGISVIEFLCQLNLHNTGATEENRELYDQFIKKLAPADVAFIAVQKVAQPFLEKADWRSAFNVFGQYSSLFPDQRITKIRQMLREDMPDQKLRNLGKGVNTPRNEYSPVLTLDGEMLYFTRKNDSSGEDIYYTKKQNGNWLTARKISNDVNTRTHEVPLSFNPTGDTMFIYGNYSQLQDFYFVKSTEPRLGKGDIYYAVKGGKDWKNLDVLKYPINSPNYETSFSMTADGKYALFATDRKGAVGGYNPIYPPKKLYFHGAGEFNLDIYVSERTKTGWSEPINLGDIINTEFAEKKPFLHPDGETLYFVSDGHYGLGGYDIFMSKRLSKTSWTEWSEPVNLGKWINSPDDDAFHITSLGTTALVVSSNNSFGGTDIYEIVVPEKFRPEPVVVINGEVKTPSGKAVSTSIHWEEKGKPNSGGTVKSNPKNGKYTIALKGSKKFVYYADDKENFGSSVEVDLSNLDKPKITDDNLTVSSFKDGEEYEPFVMKTLHFDHNSDRIRSESFFDLERLAKMLQQHPNRKLSIEGHTDSVGSDSDNLDLSKRRANSVREFLISKGVNSSKLASEGFGETKPKATNATEMGRQLNRRVEFVVK